MKFLFKRTLSGFPMVPARVLVSSPARRPPFKDPEFTQGSLFINDHHEMTESNTKASTGLKFHGLKNQENLRFSPQSFQMFSILGGNTAGGDHGNPRSVLALLLTHRRRLLNGCHIISVKGFYGLQSVKNSRTPRFESKYLAPVVRITQRVPTKGLKGPF